ncbi:hypothetical protein AB0941_33755 [Streptomyces sp. NPDC013433]|uniref:hypothetical protein n=1 Tax=Streptomyces sp. NPDC013433 TaxID=3155604 RepID=UPI003453850A
MPPGFRVANVRSPRDEQELSFVESRSGDESVARAVELAGGRAIGALPLVGMRNAVLDSCARRASYEGVPRTVFALGSKAESEPSFCTVDLVLEGVRWTYGFELSGSRVEGECLHSYPRGHRKVRPDRDASRAEVSTSGRETGVIHGGDGQPPAALAFLPLVPPRPVADRPGG